MWVCEVEKHSRLTSTKSANAAAETTWRALAPAGADDLYRLVLCQIVAIPVHLVVEEIGGEVVEY
ncbi:hypothetical protein I7I48_03342 [Histoplasma ohiense]|nr:hypothetical protein I7I48_03342 [Histoplasma ohiense (nom. inval.)]